MDTDDGTVTATTTAAATATTKPSVANSSVEQMETDEAPPAVQRTTSETEEIDDVQKTREIEICISRVLDVFWTDHCKGQIIVPETASCFSDFVDDSTGTIDFENLTFQIITEVIMQYFDGKRIDYKNGGHAESSGAAGSSSQMELDTNCPGPMLAPHNLPNQGACSYLISAYNRCWTEHDRYNGNKYIKKFGNTVLSIIYPLKEQIVRTAILILNGTLAQKPPATTAKLHRSVLLDLLYEDAVPSDFLRHLAEEAYKEPKNMTKIFGTIMNNLFTDMQAKVVGKKLDLTSIDLMNQMLNITINGSPDGMVRPICNIVSKIYNFYPALCTETPGREIAKVSYMGPFMSVSVFSEENPKLFEDEDDEMKVNLAGGMQSVSVYSKYTH